MGLDYLDMIMIYAVIDNGRSGGCPREKEREILYVELPSEQQKKLQPPSFGEKKLQPPHLNFPTPIPVINDYTLNKGTGVHRQGNVLLACLENVPSFRGLFAE